MDIDDLIKKVMLLRDEVYAVQEMIEDIDTTDDNIEEANDKLNEVIGSIDELVLFINNPFRFCRRKPTFFTSLRSVARKRPQDVCNPWAVGGAL